MRRVAAFAVPVLLLATGAFGQQETGPVLRGEAAFGDWRTRTKDITILKRLRRHDKPALLARLTTHASHPIAVVVDEDSGRVLEQHRVGNVPGVGAIGAVTLFQEFEPVDGLPKVLLPTLITTTYATPILGTAKVKFDSTTVAADADAGEVFAEPVP